MNRDLPDLSHRDPDRTRLTATLWVGGVLIALDLGLLVWALILTP